MQKLFFIKGAEMPVETLFYQVENGNPDNQLFPGINE